jgi:hypothetical protein
VSAVECVSKYRREPVLRAAVQKLQMRDVDADYGLGLKRRQCLDELHVRTIACQCDWNVTMPSPRRCMRGGRPIAAGQWVL